MPKQGYKRCGACGDEKPLDDFYRRTKSKDGRSARCKACDKVANREWHRANRERSREIAKKYRDAHPEKQTEKRQRFRRQNPETISGYEQKYRDLYPEKVSAHNALLYAVRTGKVERPETCERCGAVAAPPHGHHHDYSKPLDVEWLCVKCHAEAHQGGG